jgi:hypothetical protein
VFYPQAQEITPIPLETGLSFVNSEFSKIVNDEEDESNKEKSLQELVDMIILRLQCSTQDAKVKMHTTTVSSMLSNHLFNCTNDKIAARLHSQLFKRLENCIDVLQNLNKLNCVNAPLNQPK